MLNNVYFYIAHLSWKALPSTSLHLYPLEVGRNKLLTWRAMPRLLFQSSREVAFPKDQFIIISNSMLHRHKLGWMVEENLRRGDSIIKANIITSYNSQVYFKSGSRLKVKPDALELKPRWWNWTNQTFKVGVVDGNSSFWMLILWL